MGCEVPGFDVPEFNSELRTRNPEPRNLGTSEPLVPTVESSQQNAANFLTLVKPHVRVIAAVIGALLFAVLGFNMWKAPGALGAVWSSAQSWAACRGLDWLLPAPKRPQRLPGSLMAPVRRRYQLHPRRCRRDG